MERRELQRLFWQKDYQAIKQLIADEPDSIHRDFDGTTLLSLSVRANQFDLVELLLERGTEAFPGHILVEDWAREGQSGLQVLALLLRHGYTFPPADDSKGCQQFIRNYMRRSPFGGLDLLNGLVELGFDPVKTEKAAQLSMIGQAIASSHYIRRSEQQVALRLLSMGCSVDALENDRFSPIGVALGRKLYELIGKLLEKGATVSPLKKVALLLAEHTEIPEDLRARLLEGQEVNCVDDEGMSPIHIAVRYSNSDYISFLVDRGADINLITDKGTPLIYAIKTGHKQMVKCLVELGADVNVRFNNETALDIAISLPGFKAICTAMVKAGAKTSIELAGEGDTVTVIDSIKQSLQPGEVWADTARDDLNELEHRKAISWKSLIQHCLVNNSAKPSKSWRKEANGVVSEIGEADVRELLLRWFPLVKEKRTGDIPEEFDQYCDGYYENAGHVISDNNTRLLRGLIWVASRFADAEMSRTLRQLASDMYKKVYGVGMRNAKLGNAAIYSLSIMPGTGGLKEIIVLRAATKYNPALVNINRVFDKLAESRGMSADELAELATPDYGLTGIGEYRQTLGEYEAQLNVVSVGKCELVWQGVEKAQKSVPASIKTSHSDEIKAIKAMMKDVQTGCSAHSQRIESMYLRRKKLGYETWKEQYVDHKLIGFLARRLIWRVEHAGDTVDVIFSDDGFITHEETVVDLPRDSTISLWHPSMSDPQAVLNWRNFLIQRSITQPFKQAHREIYLLTDAERETKDYSLRFANHILKHTQFHALAGQRGWSQQRGGHWDGGSENSAYKTIPQFETSVNFEAEGVNSYDFSNSGIYECVATGAVQFSKGEPLDLEQVEPLLFSEVMRDVDLFVGVTSIGNDPNWRDRENQNWSAASFGALNETAKTRQDVLQALIPKLKIANRLELNGKFLVVKGELCTYKIHLGSSNILMEPNDSYLCIVEVKSKKPVLLPFEGDHTLSVILSKAVMLANDTKIQDPTILSQIHGNRL